MGRPDKSKCLLLVEGDKDERFFQKFCTVHDLQANITVAPCRNVGGKHNTKQGAINHLSVLARQLASGTLERLGLILDADQADNGGGVDRALTQIAEKLAPFDFTTKPDRLKDGGFVFQNTNGLADFGLWLMPNNRDEGMLEDWIKRCVPTSGDQAELLAHAQKIVAALPSQKFQPVRRPKAEMATWLAWQEKPGEGLYYALEGALLDQKVALYAGLHAWMKHVFP